MSGNRHSVYGQAQAENGLVLRSTGLKRIDAIGSGHADVGAGLTWAELAQATLARGLVPPVMAEFQDLTVGGTLSVGGMGPASHRLGAQVDHVLELDVVTGAGERVTCSLSQRPDLFHAVRAGFGQCALIVRARVRLVSAATHVVIRDLEYRNLAAFLAGSLRALGDGAFDHQLGHVAFAPDSRPTFQLKIGRFYSGSAVPDLAPAAKGLGFDRVAQTRSQTYAEYLNTRAASSHAGADEPTLFGVMAWHARPFTSPLFQVPRGADAFFALYLFRTARAGSQGPPPPWSPRTARCTIVRVISGARSIR